jgi:multiple sugar transport system substrate-binding protein
MNTKQMIKIVLAGGILSGIPALASTEINYWLWDNNQLPSYKAWAAAFEKKNPDIKIKITQTGWFDYWTALSTGFVSGTAPDVFWDHLSRYPEFVENNLLVDLAPLIARDSVPTDIYVGGLVKVWARVRNSTAFPKTGIPLASFTTKPCSTGLRSSPSPSGIWIGIRTTAVHSVNCSLN